jgi:hypothetical protein
MITLSALVRKRRSQSTRSATNQRFRPTVVELEERTLLSITLPLPGIPGPATVLGTSGPDRFIIRLQPGVPSNIQFSDDGGATFMTAALADVTSVSVSGLAGNDILTMDNSHGLVGKPSGLPISYDGGPGTNTLALAGNPNGSSLNESYSPGATSDAGNINTNGSTNFQMVSFSHLTEISDTVPVSILNVGGNDNPNYIEVITGIPIVGLNTMRVVGIDRTQLNDVPDVSMDPSMGGGHMDLLNQAFVPIDFANKATVNVTAAGGDDGVVLNTPVPATGLAALNLDGGTGTNLAMERRSPPGVTVSAIRFSRVDINSQNIFVDQLYELRLGRAPLVSELAPWIAVLNGPGGVPAVVNGIENSGEARRRMVQLWYLRYLGRQVVGGEADGWINQLLQGTPEEQVLAQILGSGEFANRATALFHTGNASQDYILALYLFLLNRTPAQSEVNIWLNAFPTLGRTTIAQMFLQSTEFRTDMVTAFYDGILHRDPDQPGLNDWVSSSLFLTQIREGFLGSSEFTNNG